MSSAAALPRILLTNDDGISAPGLHALADAVAAFGEVVIVAPDRERSASSHALTLGRALAVQKLGNAQFRVDGTPTDCVHLAFSTLLTDRLPTLVLSGINRGLNVGDDVTYSGTVAGAMEATLLGVTALAISSDYQAGAEPDYEAAARIAAGLVPRLLTEGLPSRTLLNLNVPVGEVHGIRVTRQGGRQYRATAREDHGPFEYRKLWIDVADTKPTDEPDGDHRAIAEGFASLSPLTTNWTHDEALGSLAGWSGAVE
ncbi:MAG: 5'/3'-nucleotidase SurE [Acidobacteriota bacterium]|nr:5'/3'-nucleotidase SurE [Acidobacteriota bacterium]MDH3786390.1 5'/3'-nucleotidase SurE [Acidobacteriota bacterium]